jgi:DNA-directed RNA polymerase subunit delta
MKSILERVAYLKGLADGLKIDTQNDEGKLLAETINVMESLALAIDDLEYRQDLIVEDMEDMDLDLSDLEGYVYDLDLDGFDDFDDFDFDEFEEKYLDIFDDYEEDELEFDSEESDEFEELEV